MLNPEVSALNSTVASISTATAGGQVDQERLQKLTLHLRLLSALSSAHDIALGILVDKNSSAAVPNPGGGTSSGGAKISLKPDSFNYAPCHLSNEMLTADWSSSVGAAAAYNMESVSVAFNPRLENTPKSSQWMNKTGDQLHRPTFFPRAAAAAATTGATSGPHQAAHHNTQAASTLNAFGVSSYLVSVLKAVWPIAEALDAFCLEVIEFLKRILHKDGARNRVCHLLGPHSGNLVFNKMLIPHAMRGCCMVGKNGASLGVNGSQVGFFILWIDIEVTLLYPHALFRSLIPGTHMHSDRITLLRGYARLCLGIGILNAPARAGEGHPILYCIPPGLIPRALRPRAGPRFCEAGALWGLMLTNN